MQVYILGCAKSGTTLMRRMFGAFEGVSIIPFEIDVFAFANAENESGGALVGKRTVDSLCSNRLHEAELRRQAWELDDRKIKTICMVREPLDVLRSGVPVERWTASILQLLYCSRMIDLTVPYETLVRYPDDVQQLVAGMFGLAPRHRFSDYPAFFTGEDASSMSRYEPRPLSPDRIHKEGEVSIPETHQTMVEHLARLLGYRHGEQEAA